MCMWHSSLPFTIQCFHMLHIELAFKQLLRFNVSVFDFQVKQFYLQIKQFHFFIDFMFCFIHSTFNNTMNLVQWIQMTIYWHFFRIFDWFYPWFIPFSFHFHSEFHSIISVWGFLVWLFALKVNSFSLIWHLIILFMDFICPKTSFAPNNTPNHWSNLLITSNKHAN